MNRLLVFLTIAYALGISLGRHITLEAGIYLAVGALLFTAWNLWMRQEGFKALIPFLLLFLVAGSLAFNLAIKKVNGTLQEFDGQRCTLVGMVADEPLWHDDRVVFPLNLDFIQLREEKKFAASMVRVTLYRGVEADTALAYGQEVTVRGLLVVPEGKRNPGGFDYRSFLETRGMGAAFYGEKASLVVGEFSPSLSPVRQFALELKEKMKAVLQAQLPNRAGGLLIAILFGERQALDPAVDEAVRRSGVAHMMAVSGLHVGLLAALLFLFFKRAGLGGWPACLLLMLVLFAYTYLTGLKPSTLRAFIMIAMGVLALSLGRRKDLPTTVALAGLLTLIYNPLLLFNVGMQLSYGATLSILLFTNSLQQMVGLLFARLPASFIPSSWMDNLAGLAAVTIAAQIGILPLIAFYFKEISLVALPANILILPVMALLLGIGLVCAVSGLFIPLAASFLTLAAYPLLAYIIVLTGCFGSLDFATIYVFPPRFWEIIVYYSLLAFVAWKNGTVSKNLSKLLIRLKALKLKLRLFPIMAVSFTIALPFAWWGLPSLPEKPLEVVFLDVCQGDAAYIRTPSGMNILLDGGGRPSYMGDIERVGRQVVIPYLEQRRVRKLDLVIISHPHEDHYGGLLAVLEKVPVELLATNAEEAEAEPYIRLLDLAAARGIPRLTLQKGDTLILGPSLKMDVFGPPANLFRGTGSDVNNNSLVMRLLYREVSFLFTGDIEDSAAAWLLREKVPLQSTILKVPHHGGYMSVFPSLLAAVDPQVAVIQVGRNTFGHPHGEILNNLKEHGPAVYRNDQHGAVMISSDGYTWHIKTMFADVALHHAPEGSLGQRLICVKEKLPEAGSFKRAAIN